MVTFCSGHNRHTNPTVLVRQSTCVHVTCVQVTTLASQSDGSDSVASGQARRRHKAPKLAQALNMAVEQFITVGEKIAADNPDMEGLMIDACQNIRTVGAEMHERARLFAEEPSSSKKRAAMVFASRALLGAVAKLLVLADVADVNKLLKASKRVSWYSH